MARRAIAFVTILLIFMSYGLGCSVYEYHPPDERPSDPVVLHTMETAAPTPDSQPAGDDGIPEPDPTSGQTETVTEPPNKVPDGLSSEESAPVEKADYYQLAAAMIEAYRAGDPTVTDDSGRALDPEILLRYIAILLPRHVVLNAATTKIDGVVDSVTYTCRFPLRIDSRFAEAEAILKQVIDDNMHSGRTERELLRVIHDWVVERNAYPDEFDDESLSAAALVLNGNAVCSGYADAVKIMCDYAGIPCVNISGTAANSSGQEGSHGWNAVYLEGQWLQLDATFDDPKTSDGSHVLRHEYFLVTADEIQKNHVFGPSMDWTEQLAFAEWYYFQR